MSYDEIENRQYVLAAQTTLFLYCFDFFATPLSVRCFKPTGVLPTFAIAIFVVALGTFINLAWEYAILPKIKKPCRTCRTGRGRGVGGASGSWRTGG